MTKTSQSDSTFLQEDWDFRSISEEHLEYAIIYEYGRSCEWVRKIFQDWHQQKIPLLGKSKELRPWSGLTIGDALKRIQDHDANHAQSLVVPQKVIELIAIGPTWPSENPLFDHLYAINPLFPVTFSKSPNLQKKIALLEETVPLGSKNRGFRLLDRQREHMRKYHHGELNWDDPAFVKRRHKLGERKFEIVLDLRYSKRLIKDEIGKWIDGLDDKGINKLQMKKGKAAALPWHRLKNLSSLHFKERRYSRLRAAAFLEKQIGLERSFDHQEILPLYRSDGSWSDAVEDARKYRDKLFPKPN